MIHAHPDAVEGAAGCVVAAGAAVDGCVGVMTGEVVASGTGVDGCSSRDEIALTFRVVAVLEEFTGATVGSVCLSSTSAFDGIVLNFRAVTILEVFITGVTVFILSISATAFFMFPSRSLNLVAAACATSWAMALLTAVGPMTGYFFSTVTPHSAPGSADRMMGGSGMNNL
jgi:hypothetical protein